jgi:putative DeoR family transcriptional regulator (stage III sporulation protein D)
MRDKIYNRVLLIAKYIIVTKETVRGTAKHFGMSKSTVFDDVTRKLLKIDKQLHKEVKKVLMMNKSVRHLNGGESTRRLWEKKRDE